MGIMSSYDSHASRSGTERPAASSRVAVQGAFIFDDVMREAVALSQSQRVASVRYARRESEAVLRALTAAYHRGFKHGYDSAIFAVSACDPPFPLADIARVNDETEDAAL